MAQIGYRGIYSKKAKGPFRISRSKIELFQQCQRCFWLETVKGIKRPDSPPFNINKAIDELFKKEFDVHRKARTQHPLMKKFGVEAIPFAHDQMDEWRENFVGVQYQHEPTNLLVFGAVDDVWVNPKDELIVVDYKATAKQQPVSELRPVGSWHDMYRRQMETYQWLLRQNGFEVSDTGYFVYTTTNSNADVFGDNLSFETNVIAYTGSADWVEPILGNIKNCLDSTVMPSVGEAAMGGECDFCGYSRARTEYTLQFIQQQKHKNE